DSDQYDSAVTETTRVNFKTASKLDFIHICSIANRINEAFAQLARPFYPVALLERRGKMEMIPQLPPHQGNRVRKGGTSFAIPRCASHAGYALFDTQMRL